MTGRLAGKIAIVTGASSGIGRQLCFAAAAEGASLVCSDISEASRDPDIDEKGPTHEAIVKSGGNAIFVKTDVSSAAQVQALIAKAVEIYGRLDIMFNNAGITLDSGNPKDIWDADGEEFDKVFAVNVKGVFNGCKYASFQMKKQEPHGSGSRGWIVNTASIFGLRSTTKTAAYTSSKHAVVGLTRAAALDCAPHSIHVNCFCPGWTDSAFISEVSDPAVRQWAASKHPFGGGSLGNPSAVARAAIFLATDDAAWVTGTALTIDGGYTAQ